MTTDFTHFDEAGQSRMVDVGQKAVTARRAIAEGFVELQPATLQRILARDLHKGDVLEVARLAGLMGVKRTADLIPLCHPLPVESAEIAIIPVSDHRLRIIAEIGITAKTGVEMEALTAVTVTALTIYDMCKAIDRGLRITEIQLVEKSGGRSGTFTRQSTEESR